MRTSAMDAQTRLPRSSNRMDPENPKIVKQERQFNKEISPNVSHDDAPSQFDERIWPQAEAGADTFSYNTGMTPQYSKEFFNEPGMTTAQRQKRQHVNRIEEPSGYWILTPNRSHRSHHSSRSDSSKYITPGGRFLNRTPRKHTAGTQFIGMEQTTYVPPVAMGNITQDVDEYRRYGSLSHVLDPGLVVAFHYNPTGNLGTTFGNNLILGLQAHCRAYLAKLEKRRRFKEDDAVRCIQRNAAIFFDPWLRLIMAIRPHIKRYRLEDEIILLKSELERHKAMVKVLRYENVAYQDKISRLLQLLDQMHMDGVSSDLVNRLVKELSMAVADHQKQWNSMVTGLPREASNAVIRGGGITTGGASTTDPLMESSYQQARDNAEFYRNQLEMLREEVDDQNLRTSHHYEEKIGTLSERVEQLQNLLTQESFRVERMNAEIEVANAQLNEAQLHEANLESIVANLKSELKRRPAHPMSVSDYGLLTPGPNSLADEGKDFIHVKLADAAYSAAPPRPTELINDRRQTEELSSQDMLNRIKNYVLMNQDVYDALKDTALGSGGEIDIFAKHTNDQQFAPRSFTPESSAFDADTNSHSKIAPYSVFSSQNRVENYNLTKQSEEAVNRIDLLQQKLEEETGYREDLELEAQEMRNKINNLSRQLRRQKDEHDEEIVEKEQTTLRKTRELDETIEDLTKEKVVLEKRCRELQVKLDELRKAPELSDEEEVTDEAHTRLVAESRRYLKDLELLRKEFDQYKMDNNMEDTNRELTEKDEKISQLTAAQHHDRSEIEIFKVKLQNANTMLEEHEQRSRQLTRERQNLVHRISQLEAERDVAVRESATAAGRACAERETAAGRQRDLESIREERDILRRELMDSRVTLTEASAKAVTEKSSLEKRFTDLEIAAAKREVELKSEVERYRDQVENIQHELGILHQSESATRTDNRHLKNQVKDLQDSLDTYTRRVTEFERRTSDLQTQLDTAKANLRAAQDTVSLLRDKQTRAFEDFNLMQTDHDDVQISDDETYSGYDPANSIGNSMESFHGIQTLDRSRMGRQRSSARSGGGSKPSLFSSSRSLSRVKSSIGANNLPVTGSYRHLNFVSQIPPKPDFGSIAMSRRSKHVSEVALDSDTELNPTD